jgi:hypothetical protein
VEVRKGMRVEGRGGESTPGGMQKVRSKKKDERRRLTADRCMLCMRRL